MVDSFLSMLPSNGWVWKISPCIVDATIERLETSLLFGIPILAGHSGSVILSIAQ
jgi:hypothetical protein